jgi:hypothetical protein
MPSAAPFLPPAPGAAWGGYAGPVAALAAPPPSVPPAAAAAALPPPAAAAGPGPAGNGRPEGFLSQPQHVYVTGADCGVVPAGQTRRPPCGCKNSHGPNYRPGPHATWDCPHRFIKRFGSCPGFLANGFRDPAMWHGDNLVKAGKQAWVDFIQLHDLPIPHGPDSAAPPFYLHL